MKTRDMSYEDYGLPEEEIKKAKLECTRPEKYWSLARAARLANAEISIFLMLSLAYNVSYEKLESLCFIPYSKADFYAYRRKTLALFCKMQERQ